MIKKEIRILFYQLLAVMMSALLGLASCINEDDSQCVQYTIMTKVVDSNGNTLSDTVAGRLHAYLFLDGKYDHTVTAEPDERFLLSFDGSKKASLIIVGSKTGGTNIAPPYEGEDIDSVMVHTSSPEGVYYGQFDYTSQNHDSISSVTVKLVEMHAVLRVAVRELHEYYGNGNFSVKLSGLRNSLSYDGAVTGDSITYSPTSSFISDEVLLTDSVNTLPTATNETVTIGIYKNGEQIWRSNEDNTGKTITLNAGDNKVVTIDCGYQTFGFTVLSWNSFLQSVIMK